MREREVVRRELLTWSERTDIGSDVKLMGSLALIDELYEIERATELDT